MKTKILKGSISVLIVALMLITALPISSVSFALTGGDFEYKVLEDNTIEITKYIGSDAVVTIPSTIDGKTVTSIGEQAFYEYDILVELKVPTGVKKIGESAFDGCSNLSSVELPNTLTEIGPIAFQFCINLTEINLPDSLKEIGGAAFATCRSLKKIEFPSGVTKLSYKLFFDCIDLEEITIPTSIVDVDASVFDETKWYNNHPDGVFYINNVCYSYKGEMPENTEITLKDGTTSISAHAFSGKENLKKINLPDTISKIGFYAFGYCEGLETIEIPNRVTKIEKQTFYRSGLKSITIFDNVEFIDSMAFDDCENLAEVTILNRDATIEKHAFSDYDTAILVLYGYNGSTTQTYAEENGFQFIPLDSVELSITSVAASQSTVNDGDKINFYCMVRNTGNIATEGIISVDFYYNGVLFETVEYDESIPAGQFKVIQTEGEKSTFFGVHNIKAIVNSDKTISESDYTNNALKSRLVVNDVA